MKQAFNKIAIAAGTFTLGASAFAAGPTAGDLSNLTPDMSTILTAIAAVGVVLLGVTLAQKGFDKVRHLMNKA